MHNGGQQEKLSLEHGNYARAGLEYCGDGQNREVLSGHHVSARGERVAADHFLFEMMAPTMEGRGNGSVFVDAHAKVIRGL